MKKESYLSEMEYIKDWCITILDFIAVKNNAMKQFSEITKRNLINHFNDNTQKMHEGFKQSYRDVNSIALALPISDLNEINIMLNEKFGQDLSTVKKPIQSIKKVLKKGKISNDEEYDLVLNRIDEIYANTDKADEIKRLNSLLITYKNIEGSSEH